MNCAPNVKKFIMQDIKSGRPVIGRIEELLLFSSPNKAEYLHDLFMDRIQEFEDCYLTFRTQVRYIKTERKESSAYRMFFEREFGMWENAPYIRTEWLELSSRSFIITTPKTSLGNTGNSSFVNIGHLIFRNTDHSSFGDIGYSYQNKPNLNMIAYHNKPDQAQQAAIMPRLLPYHGNNGTKLYDPPSQQSSPFYQALEKVQNNVEVPSYEFNYQNCSTNENGKPNNNTGTCAKNLNYIGAERKKTASQPGNWTDMASYRPSADSVKNAGPHSAWENNHSYFSDNIPEKEYIPNKTPNRKTYSEVVADRSKFSCKTADIEEINKSTVLGKLNKQSSPAKAKGLYDKEMKLYAEEDNPHSLFAYNSMGKK